MKVVNITEVMIKLQFKLPQALISRGFTRRTVFHAPAFQQKGINISIVSLTFEKDSLMQYEISTSLRKFLRQAEAFTEKDVDAIKSDKDNFLNYFQITQCEDPVKLDKKMSQIK